MPNRLAEFEPVDRPDFTPAEYARFAIAGARAEIERLTVALDEARAVLRGLKAQANGRAPRAAAARPGAPPRPAAPARRPWSRAARLAAAKRMKARWRARKAAAKNGGNA